MKFVEFISELSMNFAFELLERDVIPESLYRESTFMDPRLKHSGVTAIAEKCMREFMRSSGLTHGFRRFFPIGMKLASSYSSIPIGKPKNKKQKEKQQ